MVDEVPLSRPDITGAEIEAVLDVLRSGRLSIGPVQEEFEHLVSRRVGVRHAVACSSGTAGLHMALVGLGIGPGDEVITTPFSFIASSNAILFVGARPVFVDIDPVSLNMNPEAVEAAITPRTKAIVAVETFGNPRYLDRYRAIADKYEIKMIEDCCEALGSRHRSKQAGSFGHVGVFGFYPNKQITTGEGGMVVTDDDRLADCCRSLRNQGRGTNSGGSAKHWFAFERLGYNYRMSELHAALGVAQMRRIDTILEQRQQVAQRYIEHFLDNSEIILPSIDGDTVMSWFVFVVRLAHNYTCEERDRIVEGMHRHDVGAAPYFPCIHLQPFYRERFGYAPGQFPIAESVSHRTIALPFYTGLSRRDGEFAAQTFELMLSRENIRRT
ncbi:MAG: DegT/DnrJ/EryC1/StrS family aminotransferase [Phycisphaerales bacterium]|nr:DegT/DnrJ/EryC1/StrS family aminotransferase [Phycisphaerales bacterium]